MYKSKKYGDFPTWEEVRSELYTEEEIRESDLRVALLGELIRVRKEQGISQKKLEGLSGVKQSVIARMERGTTMPTLSTVLRLLAPLGKTLSIVDLPGVKPFMVAEP